MKYEYKSVTGKFEVEVDEQLYEVLSEMDRKEHNAERKHYRHNPISLSCVDPDEAWMEDDTNILGDLIDKESVRHILSCLSERQQYLIKECCLEGRTFVDLAREKGVTEGAIRHAVERAKRRIQKHFRINPYDFAVCRGYLVEGEIISPQKHQ